MWSVDMVTSRTFCVERERGGAREGPLYGMYPIADMLNHKFGNTEFRVVVRGGEGGGGAEVERFEIMCEEDVEAGEQVRCMRETKGRFFGLVARRCTLCSLYR